MVRRQQQVLSLLANGRDWLTLMEIGQALRPGRLYSDIAAGQWVRRLRDRGLVETYRKGPRERMYVRITERGILSASLEAQRGTP